MKKVRFTEEQMVAILREADWSPVADVARKHKVSEQTIYVWRRPVRDVAAGGREAIARAGDRERQAEADGCRARDVDRDAEGDQPPKMVSSQARRDQVALAMERGHSQRQACELMELPRSILKYRSVRAERDAPALDAMRRIAAAYPRYGYRRVRIFLHREGHAMGPQRTYRLWRVAGLQLPRRRPRRRIATSRPRPLPAMGPNQVWAYDFVHDWCANGQKLKCLIIIDEFTRESHAIDVAGSIRSARVIEVLTRLISVHGAPLFLRSDNGPEFVSTAILAWLAEVKIDTALIDPGKPWQNGADESFNGKFRDECLSMEYFRSRTEARVLIEIWRRHYNEVRPHSSLGYRTPTEFRRHHESTHQGAILK